MNNTDKSRKYRAKPGVMDKINAQRKARYAASAEHRAKVLANNKAYRAENRDRVNAQRKRATYGTDGKELMAAQDGKCAICATDLTALRGRDVHIDHCHETNIVRGLLCVNCNTAIGLMAEDANRLRLAADYVERFGIYK
jgi:Recombination endonuclease VII